MKTLVKIEKFMQDFTGDRESNHVILLSLWVVTAVFVLSLAKF